MENDEEDESPTALVDWFDQQSTVDWINQYQEEMQDTEPEDELTKLVNMLDEELEEPDHTVCHDEQDVRLVSEQEMMSQVGVVRKESMIKRQVPRLTIVEVTTLALVLLASDRSMPKSSRPPVRNTPCVSQMHLLTSTICSSQYHHQLHEMFQALLEEILHGVPLRDQVRFILQSVQLEYPISLPFMLCQHLTSERMLSEIQRVV